MDKEAFPHGIDTDLHEFVFDQQRCPEISELIEPLRTGEHRAFMAFLLTRGYSYARADIVAEIDFVFGDSPYAPSPETVVEFYSQLDESCVTTEEEEAVTINKPDNNAMQRVEAAAGAFLSLALKLPFSTREVTGSQGSKSILTNVAILDTLIRIYPQGAATVEFLDETEKAHHSKKTKALRMLQHRGVIQKIPIPPYEYKSQAERLSIKDRKPQQRLVIVAINSLLKQDKTITSESIQCEIHHLQTRTANKFKNLEPTEQRKRVVKNVDSLIAEGLLSREENIRDRNERLTGLVKSLYVINPEHKQAIAQFIERVKLIAANDLDVIEECAQIGFEVVRGSTEAPQDSKAIQERKKLLKRMYKTIEAPRKRLGKVAVNDS